MIRRRRLAAGAIGVAALSGAALALLAYGEARRMPVVRTASIGLRDWPAGAPPIRAVLLSDLHVGSRAMDGARLGRIVAQVNALGPDLVLIAGDFIDGHAKGNAARQATVLEEGMRALRPRLGTVAVLGNHDLWTGQGTVRATLTRAGVTVLHNQAITRGPLAIAGLGDIFTGQQNVHATWAALKPLSGAHIALTHSPDRAETLPADAGLVLAGHTHCGQVRLPLIGAIDPVARLRYPCGLMRAGGRTIVVTAGLGTSLLPFRLLAPPDLWLLTLGPK
ncbi:metallophosphoesterase [Sphingomonas naphthae]|uniref:Metallophosphoesterase n=1 Tax=Sphingomonas naphthae TaxID=1813468 RepID=A0ABY7TLA2_9SPHN|nr:metallophosphoesterase [Sphingomonas naphthae]WCT73748.1 metallophosphoesterase [Sphingomonas naphthae]